MLRCFGMLVFCKNSQVIRDFRIVGKYCLFNLLFLSFFLSSYFYRFCIFFPLQLTSIKVWWWIFLFSNICRYCEDMDLMWNVVIGIHRRGLLYLGVKIISSHLNSGILGMERLVLKHNWYINNHLDDYFYPIFKRFHT